MPMMDVVSQRGALLSDIDMEAVEVTESNKNTINSKEEYFFCSMGLFWLCTT